MTRSTEIPFDNLRRIPGLFRRWELPEVFEPHHRYQIEEAGAHADGTPLLALYIDTAADERPSSHSKSEGDAAGKPVDPILMHPRRTHLDEGPEARAELRTSLRLHLTSS
jgi:hypothetical protein